MQFSEEKIRLFPHVLKRYEDTIDDGTCFLYNAKNGELWLGNYSAMLLISLIDGEKSVAQIKQELSSVLKTEDSFMLNQSVDALISELEDKNMLERI